ncbi:GNAT family protein [Pseudomonas helvetica]|uniref:GNAT family N-acetyltransferase n=1 Tax=Pseudomonas helvetica TaxID=3136738 RepID=UPI003266AB5A
MSIGITLRELELGDIDDQYLSWFNNDDGHLNYFTGSGRVFTKQMITEDYRKGVESGLWAYFLIESDSGEKIGNVKIGPMDLKNKTSDLVCLIGNRKFIGQGVAKKAIALANEIAFSRFDIRRLQGGMLSGNIASIKAYTAAGWVVEATLNGYYWVNGEAVDRVCVSCLNPEYFPKG